MSCRGTSFRLRKQLDSIATERDLLQGHVDRLEMGILVFVRYLEAHNDAHNHNGELAALRRLLEDNPFG